MDSRSRAEARWELRRPLASRATGAGASPESQRACLWPWHLVQEERGWLQRPQPFIPLEQKGRRRDPLLALSQGVALLGRLRWELCGGHQGLVAIRQQVEALACGLRRPTGLILYQATVAEPLVAAIGDEDLAT